MKISIKKSMICMLACVLSLTLFSTASAVTVGDYAWEGHTITVSSVDVKPMFAPAEMTEDQAPIAIVLTVPDDVLEDAALLSALFEQAKLADENGVVYSPGSAMTSETNYTLLFAISKETQADALTLQFGAEAGDIPAEYIGEWKGSAGDINLSFAVNADGTGTYAFEQSGYRESYDFALTMESSTFLVRVPEGNQLGIVACEGTYRYAEDILTLEVRTTFADGRVFRYTVPCQREEAAPAM